MSPDSETNTGVNGKNGSKLDMSLPRFYLLTAGLVLVTVLSATVLYPLAYYFNAKIRIENSAIDGETLRFDGKAGFAYVIYVTGFIAAAFVVALINFIIGVLPVELKTRILNYTASGLTAAVSAVFINARLRRWEKENTHFTDSVEGFSGMKADIFKSALKSAVTAVLGLVTLGIAYPLVYKVRQSYYIGVSFVDGKKLILEGKLLPLYGKWLFYLFLTVITFGLGFPLLFWTLRKWEAEGTHIREQNPRDKGIMNRSVQKDS